MRAHWGKSFFQGNNYRTDVRNQFPGLYRARVEYSQDPLKRGRVKVRVPSLHGIEGETETYLNTIDLPWAEPSFLNAGPDMGSFVVPAVGAIVFIMFEAGDTNRPVYFGGVHGVHLGEGKNMGVFDNLSATETPAGKWVSGTSDEPPLDIFNGNTLPNPYPARTVPFKSLKGHTVFMDDTDGHERMSLIDRIGQVFGFVSPVQSTYNDTGNQTFQRGLANASQKTQFPLSKLVDNKAVIFLRDVGQQIVRLVTSIGAEKGEFVSNSTSNSNNNQAGAEFKGATPQVYVFAQDQSNNNRIYFTMDPVNGLIINLVSNNVITSSLVFNSSGLKVSNGVFTDGPVEADGNIESGGTLSAVSGVSGTYTNNYSGGVNPSVVTTKGSTDSTVWTDAYDENFV